MGLDLPWGHSAPPWWCPLPQAGGDARGLGHLSPALPWCMKRMRPLFIWAWVNCRTSAPGTDLSTTFPLAGGWME